MTHRVDLEAPLETASEEELIAMVGAHRSGRERRLALEELVRRRSSRAGPVLRGLVVDRTAPEELRSAAAVALGAKADPENKKLLLEALGAAEPAVVRRAAEALGRIGDENALTVLKRLPLDQVGGVGRSVAFARILIGYRLGMASERLTVPPAAERLEVDHDRAVKLKFTLVEPKEIRAALPSLAEALPAIAVAERGSVRFTCRSEHLWIVIAEEVAGERAGTRLGERSAVAAVVLKESHCPDGWYVYEYVLTHPTDDDKVAMFGVRASGITCHYGEMQLSGAKATMRLQALNTPYVPAIDFNAEYDGKRGTFTTTEAFVAEAALDAQKRPTMLFPSTARPPSPSTNQP